MGLHPHDDAKRFVLYISACREVFDSAVGVREKLLDAAGPRLQVELPVRRTRKQREQSLRNCDLAIVLAPSAEHVTHDVVWEAGFAAGQNKRVVYWYAGDDCDDDLPCFEAIGVDSPRLTDFLRDLLVDAESLGEIPHGDVVDVLLRRLTTELQEQMPNAQARFVLGDARAFANQIQHRLLEPYQHLHADSGCRWETMHEMETGCRELSDVLTDLEADAEDHGLLKPSTLEKAFSSPRQQSLVRRMLARGMEVRAEFLDALTAQDMTALGRSLLTIGTLHGELTALIEERSEQLTAPTKLTVRAA